MLDFNVTMSHPTMLTTNGYQHHKKRELRHHVPPIVLPMRLNLSLDPVAPTQETKRTETIETVELHHERVISKNRLWETLQVSLVLQHINCKENKDVKRENEVKKDFKDTW